MLDALQASGRYTFRNEELCTATGASPLAVEAALRRLSKKQRVVTPRRGFHVIVPLEYRSAGTPPAAWFIDDLMLFLEQPYYVALLSAAALHGASHHSPQEFQVMTDRPIRPIELARLRIRFFKNGSLQDAPTASIKTETGSMLVSTPEGTALDLVRYASSVGHLDNVATVVSELGEKLSEKGLVDAARKASERSTVQRLGYLLDLVGVDEITGALAKWVAKKAPRVARLRRDRPVRGLPINRRWRLVVNDKVEAEAWPAYR